MTITEFLFYDDNKQFLFLFAKQTNPNHRQLMSMSKPVKQEVNGTMILPPFVFPGPWFKIVEKSKGHV
jgi:hypothetical protein